jgi:hypothetical protein
MLNKSKGGFKKKHPEKTGFVPIQDMISCESSKFNILTVSSLKGFMVSMKVDENCSEYTDERTLTKFNHPVLNFFSSALNYLFKFVIVSDEEEKISNLLYFGQTYRKSTDKITDFFDETKLQQEIWLNSIQVGNIPICPAVVNVAFFKDDAVKLLQYIMAKPDESDRNACAKLSTTMNYLIGELNDPNKMLGLMTQNLIYNSTTLNALMYGGTPRPLLEEILVFTLAQLIRLFVFEQIIHLDLHCGNIIVCQTDPVVSYIIDFGRVLNFKKSSMAVVNQRRTELTNLIIDKGLRSVQDFHTYARDNILANPTEVLIVEIINYLVEVDTINMERFYSKPDKNGNLKTKGPQIKELILLLPAGDHEPIIKLILQKFIEITRPVGFMRKPDITSLVQNKYIEPMTDVMDYLNTRFVPNIAASSPSICNRFSTAVLVSTATAFVSFLTYLKGGKNHKMKTKMKTKKQMRMKNQMKTKTKKRNHTTLHKIKKNKQIKQIKYIQN